MSEPEGWKGKSVRRHVEAASAEAAGARELAENAQDEIATLRAEMAELSAKVGAIHAPEPKAAAPGRAVNAHEASKFSKVQAIWAEVARWRRFVHEARCVHAALDEWESVEFPHGGGQ